MRLETLQEIQLILLSLFSIYLNLISASINEAVVFQKPDDKIPPLNCTLNQTLLEPFASPNSWIYLIRKFYLAETVIPMISMSLLYGAINQGKNTKLVSAIEFMLYTDLRNILHILYLLLAIMPFHSNFDSVWHQFSPICDKLPDWLEENIALNASYLFYFALNRACMEWATSTAHKYVTNRACMVFTLEELEKGDYMIMVRDLKKRATAETETNDRPAIPTNAQKEYQLIQLI